MRSITLTPAGSAYASTSVAMSADVTGGTPDRVEFLLDGTSAATVMMPPYSATLMLSATTEGSHDVIARAVFGTVTVDSTATTVIVDRTPPQVTRSWPGAGVGMTALWTEPWGLVANEPLVLTSAATVVLTASGQPLPTPMAMLDADPRSVVFRPPSTMATFPLRDVRFEFTGVTDRAGNALVFASASIDVEHFSRVAPVIANGTHAFGPGVAMQPDGTTYIAVFETQLMGMNPVPGSQQVVVRRLRPGSSTLLPTIPFTTSGTHPVRLAVDPQGRPVVAFQDGADTRVHRLEGQAWVALTSSDLSGLSEPALVLDPQGNPAIAGFAMQANEVRTVRHSGTAFAPAERIALAEPPAFGERLGVALAAAPTGGALALAYIDRRGNHRVVCTASSTGGAWTNGQDVSVRPTGTAASPALVWNTTTLFLAFTEDDGFGADLHVAAGGLSAGPLAFGLIGRPLDVDLGSTVSAPSMAIDATGQPIVAWSERAPVGTDHRLWVSRIDGSGQPQLLAGQDVEPAMVTIDGASLAAGAGTFAIGYRANDQLRLARWNGQRPFGIASRPMNQCTPIASTGNPFNGLFSGQCFSGADGGSLLPIAAAELIPYELNSALWSDGTLKRRWVRLPTGATVGYTDAGAFSWPVGTVFVKEFSVQSSFDPASRAPVETRLMVKEADGGWEGYSYQWDDQHQTASLLYDTTVVRKSWPTNAGAYSHIYPTRTMCKRCHTAAAGFVLGPEAAQLNRTADYDGVADEQLRVWNHLGLFGSGPLPPPPTPFAGVHSTRAPLEHRVRGYLAANCAHCHRPGGERPSRDMRWETPLASTNLCAVVHPGDAGTSLLHTRFGRVGSPMPPVATDILDQRALGLVDAWINGLTSCP